MTEGHNILVDPSNLKKGDSIGKGAFATVYKAKLKRETDEVRTLMVTQHIAYGYPTLNKWLIM